MRQRRGLRPRRCCARATTGERSTTRSTAVSPKGRPARDAAVPVRSSYSHRSAMGSLPGVRLGWLIHEVGSSGGAHEEQQATDAADHGSDGQRVEPASARRPSRRRHLATDSGVKPAAPGPSKARRSSLMICSGASPTPSSRAPASTPTIFLPPGIMSKKQHRLEHPHPRRLGADDKDKSPGCICCFNACQIAHRSGETLGNPASQWQDSLGLFCQEVTG